MSLNLLLYGAPGSGKGTQAALLKTRLEVPHISTGDYVRAQIKEGTELGRMAKPIYDRGELLPDEILINMIERRLEEPDCARGVILDGFPRTIPQAEALDAFLSTKDRAIGSVIYLQVPTEVLMERLAGRFQQEHREDDKPDATRIRIEVYLKQTVPVLEHYRKRGIVHEIDGVGTVDEIGSRIADALPPVTASC